MPSSFAAALVVQQRVVPTQTCVRAWQWCLLENDDDARVLWLLLRKREVALVTFRAVSAVRSVAALTRFIRVQARVMRSVGLRIVVSLVWRKVAT
jgi:hypothetical protein